MPMSLIGRVREQLYVEENQRLDKNKRKLQRTLQEVQSSQRLIQPPSNDTMPIGPGCIKPIMIDGLLDVAQQSRVSNEAFRENINKARDVTLENCPDLMQIYEDQDPGFFVKHGVEVGAVKRFVRDIGLWVKRRKEVTCNENIHLA
ncbi:hypothetical protein N7516_008950 [Penicillium verrucosum]|uniref:uncharacterized protein n=1 Tax=Penicillium verrucosum TaxID=60171 RepID=UPI0025456A2F|nr:uncharacterized protein N7516_008950 [Penicillium verrucosum]KAJ5927177.1 hypothetical protein N7516_008950 [Penicillium verrucosum]